MSIDPKLLEGIAFFEKMRQTMPLDRASLEFLAVAYEQTGDTAKRRATLIELAECLLQEGDLENAQIIAARLSATSHDPTTYALVERVAAALQAPAPEPAHPWSHPHESAPLNTEHSPLNTDSASSADTISAVAISASAATSEISLVWHWIDTSVLTKEVGMDVIHILTEKQMSGTPTLMSALATLDELHPELTEDLMARMIDDSQLPLLPLDLLEPSPAALRELPPEYIRIKGVVPWALMGQELLCALLNPLNNTLHDEVRQLTNRTCHFSLAYPRAITTLLTTIGV